MKTLIKKSSSILLLSLFTSQSSLFAVDFQKDIWPILVDNCLKCHGPEYSNSKGRIFTNKGGLRMDQKELFQKGGKKGEVLIAGEPEKSKIYKLPSLPLEDDDIMPPKGDPLTQVQLQLIKLWILEGANFGSWEKATQAELDQSRSQR